MLTFKPILSLWKPSINSKLPKCRPQLVKNSPKPVSQILFRSVSPVHLFLKTPFRLYGTSYIESDKRTSKPVTKENRPFLIVPEDKEVPVSTSTVSGIWSQKSFLDLGISETVLKALEELKIRKPTLIQELTIPQLLTSETNQDVIFADQTGSGKTLAYLLPILSSLKEDEIKSGVTTVPHRPRALILVPSRELANQVLKVIKFLSHHLKLRSGVITGSSSNKFQKELLEQPTDVIVATPGRLMQHYEKRNIYFSKVRHVVVDEMDTMLQDEAGFAKDVLRVTDAIRNRVEATQGHAQVVFCGATVTQQLLDSIDVKFPNCKHIISPTLHKTVAKVEQQWITVSADKIKKLLEVLQQQKREPNNRKNPEGTASKPSKQKSDTPAKVSRTMIFCNTIASCRFLERALQEKGHEDVCCYHGEITAEQRVREYETFVNGTKPIMVCTDIASRGIDVLNVDHVILFDFPLNAIDYLHRIGRTARGGGSGKVTNLIMKRDFVLADAIKMAIKQGKSLERLTSSNAENKEYLFGTGASAATPQPQPKVIKPAAKYIKFRKPASQYGKRGGRH